MIDVQQGLAFGGGRWEFPDRDIMPAWQGQAMDVTQLLSSLQDPRLQHILSNSSDWLWNVCLPKLTGGRKCPCRVQSQTEREDQRAKHSPDTRGALLQHYQISPQNQVLLTPSLC